MIYSATINIATGREESLQLLIKEISTQGLTKTKRNDGKSRILKD